MSQAKICKEDVAKAMAMLRQAGNQNPGLQVIRAAVGGKGSLNTIAGFKKELDQEALAAKDPPQALEAFRGIWAEALQVGHAQRDPEFADLQEIVRALTAEAKEYEGRASAFRSAATSATKKHEASMVQLNKANQALIVARSDAERNATKLIEIMEESRREVDELRRQLAAEKSHVHELELKLARAVPNHELPTDVPPSFPEGRSTNGTTH